MTEVAQERRYAEDEADPRRWWILLVLCLSLFMVIMGNTVLNIALPAISESLDATGTQLQWMVDAYSLLFAGLLFTAGAIGDRFGRKGTLTVGLVIFGIGSAVATTASASAVVIACRGVMGIGAALVMPSTLSILTHVFPPHERGKAIGAWAGVAGAAGAVGPIASGWLLENFYWGSVFWLNIPVVILAIVAGRFLVPRSRDPRIAPLDPVGAILSIGMIGSLIYAVIEAHAYGWTDQLIIVSFIVAVLLGVCFVWWELRNDHPMLDIRYFARRGYTGGSLSIMTVFFGMFGMFFLLTQYLQMVHGYTALEAGVRTLPFAVTMMIAAPSSAALAAKFGTRTIVPIGLAVAGSGLLILGKTATVVGGYHWIALSIVVLALGMGLTMSPSTEAIMSSLPQAKAGIGSATNDTTRELGGALGVAVLGTVFGTAYKASMGDAAAGLPAQVADRVNSSLGEMLQMMPQLGARGPEILAAAKSAFVDGMDSAFTIGAIVAFVGAVVAIFVLPNRTALDDAYEHAGDHGR
ncbi:MAG: DHA2 family efflux MFS transporter permease subunit [Microthrixaceae bacterium]